MDGYGFYEGFFSWRRTVEEKVIPSRLAGYARRAFDHGLGRSLWFSTGANVDRIVVTIGAFPESRQGDLWAGIGLACAYAAGVVDREAIQTFTAPRGTLIFCNTSGLHRGGFATESARVLATATYCSPASLAALSQRNYEIDPVEVAALERAPRYAVT